MINKNCIKISFILLIFLALICPAMSVTLTDYTDLSENTTVHIRTEMDLSQNFTVLFNNEPLNYAISHDIVKTGLDYNEEYSILLISDYGQIQEITGKTSENPNIKPFYYQYGSFGLFALCVILLIIGYFVPMANVLVLLFSLLGFIFALKIDNNGLTGFIFIILMAISAIMTSYKVKW